MKSNMNIEWWRRNLLVDVTVTQTRHKLRFIKMPERLLNLPSARLFGTFARQPDGIATNRLGLRDILRIATKHEHSFLINFDLWEMTMAKAAPKRKWIFLIFGWNCNLNDTDILIDLASFDAIFERVVDIKLIFVGITNWRCITNNNFAELHVTPDAVEQLIFGFHNFIVVHYSVVVNISNI